MSNSSTWRQAILERFGLGERPNPLRTEAEVLEEYRGRMERELAAAGRRAEQADRAAGDYPRDSSEAEHWLRVAADERADAAQTQWHLDNHGLPAEEWSLRPHLTEEGRWAR